MKTKAMDFNISMVGVFCAPQTDSLLWFMWHYFVCLCFLFILEFVYIFVVFVVRQKKEPDAESFTIYVTLFFVYVCSWFLFIFEFVYFFVVVVVRLKKRAGCRVFYDLCDSACNDISLVMFLQ